VAWSLVVSALNCAGGAWSVTGFTQRGDWCRKEGDVLGKRMSAISALADPFLGEGTETLHALSVGFLLQKAGNFGPDALPRRGE